ncbi:MAG: hypothetical protein IMW95_02195 [Moorella humiferrea]|nr:hypothetical protein [Moorella humiferrea]
MIGYPGYIDSSRSGRLKELAARLMERLTAMSTGKKGNWAFAGQDGRTTSWQRSRALYLITVR